MLQQKQQQELINEKTQNKQTCQDRIQCEELFLSN